MAASIEVPAPPAQAEPEGLYENINGQIVQKPELSAYEIEIACLFLEEIGPYARSNGLGRAVYEMLFRIAPDGTRDLRPDVAFISHRRWPIERRAPRTNAWEVVPDLVVEVLSPFNKALEDAAKIEDFLRAGVLQVWVVYPDLAKVYVYDSPTSVAILARNETLYGGAVLPGFRLPLATLFGPEQDA
jgi:Uma2 family endonuclease